MSEQRAAAGRALATLLADGTTADLTGRDLAIASSARDSILSSCEQMLAAAAGRTHRQVRPTIADLAQRPLTHLSLGLADHPRLRVDAPAPTDLADQPPADSAAARWTGAAEHLLIAAADLAPPLRDRPPAEAAWAIVADVAALTRAVGHLDGELHTAHQHAGNTSAVERLGEARSRGLGVIAATALDQATAGDVDFAWRPRAARLSIRPVLSTTALPENLDHLGELLRHAPVLRAVDVAQLALGQHYLAVTTANTLSATAPGLTARLRKIGDTLAGVVQARPDVASILPGDRRPVIQLGNILRIARQLTAGDEATVPDREVALAVAQRLPGILRTLHSKAVAEATAGRWLTPDHEPVRPTWRRTTSFTPLRLTDVTARASRQAKGLTDILGPVAVVNDRAAPAVSALVALASRSPATMGRPVRPHASGTFDLTAHGSQR